MSVGLTHQSVCYYRRLILIFRISIYGLLVVPCLGQQPSEIEILLRFKESLTNVSRLGNWKSDNAPICRGKTAVWTGLVCNETGNVKGLRFDGFGLAGKIDVDALSELPEFHLLGVANNNFEGPLPEVQKLRSLRGLYASNNRFSGKISDSAFTGMNGMKRVQLANNEFTGRIPTSLTELKRLVDLQLQNNRFGGPIPDFPQDSLDVLDFANNNLEGPIPPHLSNRNESIFAGNPKLCGKPLKLQCPKKKKSTHKTAIIIAVVVAVLCIAAILATVILRCRSYSTIYKKSPADTNLRDPKKAAASDRGVSSSEVYASISSGGGGVGAGKLCFVRTDREKFDLEDLLRAPAEVLGSGSFGSSYKAMLITGTVVVRRFRQMNSVGRDEFHEHMAALGRLSHPNLLPLAAFYYRKEEKLLISDFVQGGSLASVLHGKNSPHLDWPTRLKIIKGVARGLSYLYQNLPTLTLPHGNLKSSNILLDQTLTNPLISDYALAPVTKTDHAQHFMAAYKSPEFTQHDRVTRKTDVWSLGILILEMLTGRFPENYWRKGKAGGGGADLATWVNSVVREEWTGEVFDKEMMGWGKNGEGQMLRLLKIGICCCEWDVDGKRFDIGEALERIEEVNERDVDGDDDVDDFGSFVSDVDFSFSKTI